MAALATDAAMGQAFALTSPGDRSILGIALDREDGAMTTIIGSPNDALWTHFVEHGWMDAVPINAELQSLMPQMMHRRLTELGRRAIPVILPILLAEN
jgi:hypothetical protein